MQFDIASCSDRFKLNTGIAIIPLISYNLGIVFFDCIPYLLNCFTKVFFFKGLSLEHNIFAFRQFDNIESFGNFARIICCYLYTLHVFRCSCDDVFFREP